MQEHRFSLKKTLQSAKPTKFNLSLAFQKKRPLALFFVFLMVYSSAQTIAFVLASHYALAAELKRQELILKDGSAGEVPYVINNKFEDGKVKPIKGQPKPLESVKQKVADVRSEGVTDAARQTAISPNDPVHEYYEKQKSSKDKVVPLLDHEKKEKRTAFSSTYLNSEGGETLRMFNEPVNYKLAGKNAWAPIKAKFKDDTNYNKSEAAKESVMSKLLPGKPFVKKGVTQDDGLVRTTFRPLGEESSAIAFDQVGGFLVKLLGSNSESNPTIGNYQNGQQYVKYSDAWKNTDVYYEQQSAKLKETIVLKSKDVPHSFGFSYLGADLKAGQNGTVTMKFENGQEITIPELAVYANGGDYLNGAKVRYELNGNVLQVVVNQDWLNSVPDSKFPLSVDPTYDWRGISTSVPGGDWGEYWAYKSDGWSCPGNRSDCVMNAGALYDNGAKAWRSMMHLPLTQVYGQQVAWANYHTERYCGSYGCPGYDGWKGYEVTWAQCFGYNCFSGAPRASGGVDWGGDLDATALMQWFSKNNVGDAWLMIKAQNEGDLSTRKALSAAHTYLDVQFVHYNQQTAIPTLVSPVDNAAVVVSRPTLKMNPVTDPDGDIVKYAFHLLDSKGNIVAHSGELDTAWWTIPDDVLVDGEKYQWRGWVMERNASNQATVESGWRQTETRNFTFDLRTGKDKTQTYDDVGPLSVSLNKGNATTSTESHSISALGGTVGVGLEYNTPGLSRPGLTGYYYNETSGGRKLAIKVKDAGVDMNWGTGSPYPGTVQSDNFTINWQGYFIAPEDGNYTFGGSRDDVMSMSLTHDGTVDQQFDFSTCCGLSWSTKSVSLKKGQSYPISVWMQEIGGSAQAQLYVRTPSGTERIVPSEWLRTQPDVTSEDNLGLTARFYKNEEPNVNTSFQVNDKTPLVFTTKVPTVSRDWGTGTLVPYDVASLYTDNMIVNYSGYVTIPVTGDYKFGGGSDDGLRIRLGTKEVTSSWYPHGYAETWQQTAIHFEAGQVVPISVDFFEATSAASAYLMWDGPAGKGVIDGQYLSTQANVLPRGWKLSIDPDGSIPYEFLQAKANGNVELVDSDGFTHIYAWTGSGFKPPVNENGYLVRNTDSSYTLTDTDGRIYEFSALGVLNKITSPIDDKKPSALQYEYRNTATSDYTALPKINKIVDGVDSTRYGQIYYYNEDGSSSVCTVPAGYYAPPAGFVCGYKTFPDGQVTRFYYDQNKQLARVEQPGSELQDYGYDADGRINVLRDVAANDAIMAGLRTADDTTINTAVTYDNFYRVNKVLAPAPYAANNIPAGQSNNRAEHIFEYGFQSSTRNVTNMPAPAGYLQYIEYDDLFRTVKSCDNLGLCSETNWHPQKDLVFATVDSNGLKSTSIYDDNDNAIEEYDAAPSSWFPTPVDKKSLTETERRPLAAYTDRVARSETKYDEGLVGPATAWQGARLDNLFGGAKLHTTGIDTADASHMGRDFRTSPVSLTLDQSITPGYGFSATGKIKFPQSGAYTFKIQHDDGARLFIDDTAVVDNWKVRTAGGTQNTDQGTFTATAGTSYRFRIDYIHFDDGTGPGVIDAWLNGPGVADISGSGLGTNKFGSMITPDYGLTTSVTTVDKDRGTSVVKTNYQDPAYGLVNSTTLDPNGLNYQSTAAYEPASTGYFRQLTKTLPGGTVTKYSYYGGNEQVDNPCTTAADPASQGGRLKLKTEADPDGAGTQTSRTIETVYDQFGRVVATRINTEAWTCTEYDVRGRITKVTVPDFKSGTTVVRKGRTLINNYAYGGNPFVTTMQDETGGFILTETDLLGRTLRYMDQRGFETKSFYNDRGQLTKRTGPAGTEEYTYNDYGQLITQRQDSQNIASISYDTQGRVAAVAVPSIPGLSLSKQTYDEYQRQVGQEYTLPTQTTGAPNVISEQVRRAVGGDILSTGLNNISLASGTDFASTTTNQYSYDMADRLTAATVAGNVFEYGYGAQDIATTCKSLVINPSADRNSNRTSSKLTVDGTVKKDNKYCYDYADRLIKSGDPAVGVPVYDTHGNITRLGTNALGNAEAAYTSFTYDNADRNTQITQGSNKVVYTRDGQGRIAQTAETFKSGLSNVTKTYNYGYTGSGDSPDFLTDTSNVLLENYVPLPGGMLLTIRPTQATTAAKYTVSLTNMHGDTLAVVDGAGQITKGLQLYSPYGERIAPSANFVTALGASADPNAQNLKKLLDTTTTIADNRSNTGDYGWLGEHQKQTETLFTGRPIQMGARVYLAGIGRFLQADPIEDGGANTYAYPTDPINDFDIDGNKWRKPSWKTIAKVGIAVGAGVAGAAFCGATAGIGCAVIAGVALGAASGAATNLVDQHGNGKKFSWKSLAKDTVVGGALGGLTGGVGAKLSQVKFLKSNVTAHALAQIKSRNGGRGVAVSAVRYTLKNGSFVAAKRDTRGRLSIIITSKRATVVINSKSKVVTAWAKSSKYWNKWWR